MWKVPAAGGAPHQVTHQGGHAALASADGKTLYYAKTQYANPEIWQIPVNGGPERILSAEVRPASWAAWAVADKGIVFAASTGQGRPQILLFNTSTRAVTPLATVERVPFWLSASGDASELYFDQPGWQQAQIMLVRNFK